MIPKEERKKTGMAVPLIYSSNLCIYVSDDHHYYWLKLSPSLIYTYGLELRMTTR